MAQPAVPARFAPLAVAALGVVFGDIGTSPLYAYQQVFSGAHVVEVSPTTIYGSVSLVFWTLTLIVTVKYVLVVMRADNDGEGGIMALAALTTQHRFASRRTAFVLLGLGVFGAALFYGDSMITPAVSVLSAVEGLEVADPGLTPVVIPIALVVLVALFAVQRFGTARVGGAFGPVMVVWFVAIGVLGAVSIAATPGILGAISPTYALELWLRDPLVAFLSLGSVILCVTGAEALYADMGHFGRGPIRLSWFALVSPALYLNYLGQAALVSRDPATAANPFYELVPDPLQFPMVVLATVATVIASQAVITGAFSMTEQAIKLRFLPRMTILHTSAQTRGQIYVPFINWLLMIAVVGLVVGFQSSEHLASAYGLAVSGTFVITTLLITVVARTTWRTPLPVLVPVAAFFLVIDLSFFVANLTKFSHGGWFPLLVAAVVFTILMTWSRGRKLYRRSVRSVGLSESGLQELSEDSGVSRVPGTTVYLTLDQRVPLALAEYVRSVRVFRENTVQITYEGLGVPRCDPETHLQIDHAFPGFTRVVLRYGFMERLDLQADLRAMREAGLDIGPDAVFVVHTARIHVRNGVGMMRWRKHLYAFMVRNAADPGLFFRLRDARVIEFTSVVDV